MCGISGILNHDRAQPVDSAVLRAMTDVMGHRGPDGRGEHICGSLGLGHRRLSIIDLDGGAQPLCNENGEVWVTFNGEIYNFKAVRKELEASGHRFKTSSDTEVIVHAYEQWGEGAVARLQGMFAFAVWDARRRTLLVARDRVGIKPLYYFESRRHFVFASELKAMLLHPGVSRRLNPRAIDRFFTYYYGAGTDTLFNDIHKLDPGHYLVVRDGAAHKVRYWDLEPHDSPRIDFRDAVAELRGLLRRTVKSHMMSDVPVGVLLSGGVDSTGVLRYAAEESSRPLHTFTIGFAGEGFADERPFAKLAAERYGSRHQALTLSADDFLSFLPTYVWHMEEPVCEPPAVALYYVSKLARDSGVKVLLSGEGGDEAFAGYQTYRNLLLLERLKSLAGSAKPGLRVALQASAALGLSRLSPFAKLVSLPFAEYYFSRTATPQTFFNRVKADLYRPEFAAELVGYRAGDVTRSLCERVQSRPWLDQMLYVDSKSWLPDDLLVKADKMTMAASVELRVPLLDTDVLEFAASLPSSFKLRLWNGKRILKAALEDAVPREILERPKAGFPVPYARWLRTEGREMVSDTLYRSDAAVTAWLDARTVRTMTEDFFRTGRASKEVFCLLTLELWLRRFTAPQPAPSPDQREAGAAAIA